MNVTVSSTFLKLEQMMSQIDQVSEIAVLTESRLQQIPDISDETIHSLNEGFLKFCKDGGHTFNKKTDMIGPPMSKEQMPTPDKETQMPRPEVEKRRQGNEALKDVIEEPEMQPEKKRKRGRPRKSDSTKSKESEKSGRPAKRVETASGSGGSKDSKNTGQPSKQVEAATGPPKKKRGRPPKDKSKVAGQAGAMAGSSTQGDKLTPPSTNESGSSGNPTSSESISPSSNPQSSAYPTPPKDSPE
ncbi:hypothetical protein ACLMJK_004839 [Lecanora helva]